MALSEIKDDHFKCDKLTIFTTETEVTHLDLRSYIVKHWRKITEGMKNSSIVIFGGVHGNENGKLGGKSNIHSLEKQVISFTFTLMRCFKETSLGPTGLRFARLHIGPPKF